MFFNDKSEHIKNRKLKDEHVDVARTRKCAECGSDEYMRWLALHPSKDYKYIYKYILVISIHLFYVDYPCCSKVITVSKIEHDKVKEIT